jgi:hypothetical protein
MKILIHLYISGTVLSLKEYTMYGISRILPESLGDVWMENYFYCKFYDQIEYAFLI